MGAARSAKGARDAPGVWSWSADGAPSPAGLATRAVGQLTILRYAAAQMTDSPCDVALTTPKRLILLIVLTKSRCDFKGDDRRWRPMNAKEVLVVEGGTLLEMRPESGARLSGLALPTHLLAPQFLSPERLKSANLQSHGLGMAPLLFDLLDRLAEEAASTNGAGALIDAVGGLLSATVEDSQPRSRPPRGEAGRARLDQIGRYLRRHFADPDLSAEDVATAVGVSRRYLHRLYAQFGRSFRGELVALRIDSCVRSFLDESQINHSIAEIAFAAGYTDISKFYRHFRRLQGKSPSDMRRVVRAEIAAYETKKRRRRGPRPPEHRIGRLDQAESPGGDLEKDHTRLAAAGRPPRNNFEWKTNLPDPKGRKPM